MLHNIVCSKSDLFHDDKHFHEKLQFVLSYVGLVNLRTLSLQTFSYALGHSRHTSLQAEQLDRTKKLPNAKVGGVLPVRPAESAFLLVEDYGVKDAYFVHINPTPTTLAFFNIQT